MAGVGLAGETGVPFCAEARVIRYNPPKARVYGHQIGRLTATAVVERCASFLDAHCTILRSQPSELMIGWKEGPHAALTEEVVGEINLALGPPRTSNVMPSAYGELLGERCWQFAPEQLAAVAAWFDRLADGLKTQEVVAYSSTLWLFAWRDELPPLRVLESPGGTLGIHLGRPHRIMTVFLFRDLDQYARIKAALSSLGLVELSDRHLHPKAGGGAAKRRAK